jgi:hypothetical protein
VWIVVTQTYLICWESRRVNAPIICMQHLFLVFLHSLLWWNYDETPKNLKFVYLEREKEREKERKNREKTMFFSFFLKKKTSRQNKK